MQVKLYFALGADFGRSALAGNAVRGADAEPFHRLERRDVDRVRDAHAQVIPARRPALPAARDRSRTIDLPVLASGNSRLTEGPVLVATPMRQSQHAFSPSFPFDAGVDAVDPGLLDVTI